MGKFCTRCGAPLNPDGKCPKCDINYGKLKEMPDFGAPKQKKPKKKTEIPESVKKKIKITFITVIVVLAIYTVSLITVGTLVYFNKLNIPFINDIFVYMNLKEEKAAEIPARTDEDEASGQLPAEEEEAEPVDLSTPYRVTPPDADEYFKNNSTVASQLNAGDSADVHTESEAYDNFTERGFTEYPITTNYSMSGEYYDSTNISGYSSNKHPMYQTMYVIPSGKIWQVFEINGTIIAHLLSMNDSVPVIVSETNTITSYDSTKNKFYINTPNESVAKVKQVARIDSQTLDNFAN